MNWRERVFLLSIPVIVLAVFFVFTPDAPDDGYVLEHVEPDAELLRRIREA